MYMLGLNIMELFGLRKYHYIYGVWLYISLILFTLDGKTRISILRRNVGKYLHRRNEIRNGKIKLPILLGNYLYSI